MFRETVTSADGTASEGTCTEAHALGMLRKAVQRGYRVEATRQGGAVIVRDYMRTGATFPVPHTVTLEPDTAPVKLTATMRRDLDAIAARIGKSAAYLDGHGRIRAGLYCIPPAASRRLLEHGLAVKAGEAGEAGEADRYPDGSRIPVAVTLAAWLARLAQDHHTTTSEPRGWRWAGDIRPGAVGLNKGGGRGGKLYDGSSVASCACHWSHPCEDRDNARRKAHQHRQEVTADMIRAYP